MCIKPNQKKKRERKKVVYGAHPSTVTLAGCPWFHWWSLHSSLPCPPIKLASTESTSWDLCSFEHWGEMEGSGLFSSFVYSILPHSEYKMQAGHNSWEDFLSCSYTAIPPYSPFSWSSNSGGSNPPLRDLPYRVSHPYKQFLSSACFWLIISFIPEGQWPVHFLLANQSSVDSSNTSLPWNSLIMQCSRRDN